MEYINFFKYFDNYMKYISIGNTCCAKYNIDKYKGTSKTLFFDWIRSTMNVVIKILECNNIDNILYFDNIIRDINNPYRGENSVMTIKSFNSECLFRHDFSRDYTDTDTLYFIDKYKRRFNRIIEYIKSNEQICFVRVGYVSYDEIYKFNEVIKHINPECDFTLVIIDNNENNNTEIFKQKNLLYFKLNFIIPSEYDIEYDWTLQYFDWNKIFLDIENNINK
jgi:hypothetical protein